MKELINIVLPTFRFRPITRDLIRTLIAAVEDAPDLHLTIADGQEDGQKREWIVSKAEKLAARGGFTYIETKDLVERVWLAAQRKTEWVFSVSDDDVISVNLIRCMRDEAHAASPEVSVIAPYTFIPYNRERAWLSRVEEIAGETQAERITALVSRVEIAGDLMWATVRRQYYLDWLSFSRARRVRGSYLDQVLVAYLIMQGKVASCKEVCVYAKDNQVWCDLSAAVSKDAAHYPDKSATLVHELFMVADLYTFLTAHGLEDEALVPLTAWTEALLMRAASLFDSRCSILGIEHSKECEMVRSLIHEQAARAKLLRGRRINRYHEFYRQVQSVCTALIGAPNGPVQRVSA